MLKTRKFQHKRYLNETVYSVCSSRVENNNSAYLPFKMIPTNPILNLNNYSKIKL